MIIVGELINASRKAIQSSIESQDDKTIKQLARNQFDAGANYIDVNAGVFVGKEPEYLKWLVEIVQTEIEAPC
jgi:5-methyltetrahydrofolate--homocysteine methyltransferase